MSDLRTDLPSVKAANFEQRIREVLMTYLGRQGNPLDRGVTLRDLLDSGIAEVKEGYTLRSGPGGSFVPLQPGVAFDFNGDLTDLTPPPTPSGFAVNAAISNIFIEHDAPQYTQGGGHLRTRVYGATYVEGPLPTFQNAIEITQFTGTVHAHPTNPSTTWHLWIKWETRAGVLSASPAGGTNGLVTRTGEDVALLLEALTGQITESQLYQDLAARIDLIDGPSTTPGTVAFQVAEEAAIRADQISIEAHQRLIGVQDAANAALAAAIAADNERTDRIADVAIAKTELYTDIQQGLSAEAGERTLLAAQMRGGYTGNDLSQVTTGLLYQERIARSTQDSALALQITLLSAGVGEQFDWADIWYFDAGTEGWGGNGAPTAVAGFLRPALQSSGAYVTSPAGLALDAVKYKQIRLRIRKVGTPTFAGFLWWNAAGQSWDPSRRITLTEPTYDANGIGLITVNTEWTGTVDQLRLDLSSAQTGTDYFEIDWFAVGRPSPGASTAQVLEEQQARTTADSAEATAREALSTAILGQADPTGAILGNLTQGLLYEEREARSAEDSAIASDVSTLQSSVTNLTGDISTISSSVTTLEQTVANLGGSSASVTQELLSISRKLDADAETVLRNVLAGEETRTLSVQEVALAREDLTTRIEEGLLAEATARLLLAAQVDTNSAAITSESTTRATQDSALSTQINTVSATANAKNRTYYQTTAPTDGLITGDLWFDTDDGNKPYRWSGVLWQETTDTRITANTAAIVSEQIARADADSALASDITTLTATVDSNFTTLDAAIQSESSVRVSEDSALASQINTVQSSVNLKARTYAQAAAPTGALTTGDLWVDTDDNNKLYRYNGTAWELAEDQRIEAYNTTLTAAIQTEATTRATETGDLFAKYTVKIDNNGYVSGFGLASTANNATPFSEFAIRADRFYIASPNGPGITPIIPFVVNTTEETINGVTVPVGVYMDAAFIKNGTITNAKIANATIDDAKIGNLSASKLTAGDGTIGNVLKSANYVAGTQGWRVDSTGNAELSNATVRGTVFASNGQFLGTLLGGSATNYTTGLGLFSGWTSGTTDANYRWRVGNPTGARIQWTGTAIEVYNDSNTLTLSSGAVNWSAITGQPSNIFNSNISINSNGTLSGAGGGQVSLGGLGAGAFATLSQINSSNISTYIASAAIGNAYISSLNASKLTAGSITTDKIQVGAVSAASNGSVSAAIKYPLSGQLNLPLVYETPVYYLTTTANSLVITHAVFSTEINNQNSGTADCVIIQADLFIDFVFVRRTTTRVPLVHQKVGNNAGAIVHRSTNLSAGQHSFYVKITGTLQYGGIGGYSWTNTSSYMQNDVSIVIFENKV